MTNLIISNDGQEITATNYYESELFTRMLFYLSVNAGCFRLLSPVALDDRDIQGTQIVISRGTWDNRPDSIEIMFDDSSDTPYTLHLSKAQIDRLPIDADSGKMFQFILYAPRLQKQLSSACYYRKVKRLPCMNPWGK